MRRLMFLSGLLVSSLIPVISNPNVPEESGAHSGQIISELLNQNKNIKSIKMTILMRERIKDKMNYKKANFKLSSDPLRIYIRQEFPHKGLEVMYIENQNENKAWVNPNSFPWKTFSLNPMGNIMRNGHHHSIFKSNISFLFDILSHLWSKYENEIDQMTTYFGIVTYDNRSCQKIQIHNPNFGYRKYIIKEKENLEDISNKLKVNDHMILSKNKNLRNYDEIQPGTEIIVPSDYGSQIIIYIDNVSKMLAGIKIYDERGLFEEYTYRQIIINPIFTENDFDIENPDYGFR